MYENNYTSKFFNKYFGTKPLIYSINIKSIYDQILWK